VNFTEDEPHSPGGEWNFDTHRRFLAREAPGPPEPGGAWDIARALVRDYEFSDPDRVRAVYDGREELLGRNMLLEGRFYGLRFDMGVRVTVVIDETREGDRRVWGWGYETLEGHLERGRMTYEVNKDMSSGTVEFVITGFSQDDPALDPVLRLGWRLFGRATQLGFYRRCGARMYELVQARLADGRGAPGERRHDGLLLAPSDARPGPFERFALRIDHPSSGRRR
jgi:uncharacterized protein (UPF0548 family)